jgi:hypothetical protein
MSHWITHEYGAGLEYRKVTVVVIDDRRHAPVRVDLQEPFLFLFEFAERYGSNLVGQAQFFERDRNFPSVRCGGGEQFDHGSFLTNWNSGNKYTPLSARKSTRAL